MISPTFSVRSKRVLVLGLGEFGGGIGTVRWLVNSGALVRVVDRRPSAQLRGALKQLKQYSFERRLGRERLKDLDDIDLVVANPAIPIQHPILRGARKSRIPVINIAALFFSAITTPVIGVTGTRGKSSTAALIASFLRASGYRVALVGLPGTSLLDAVNKPLDVVVAELSSWQLEFLSIIKHSPDVAVVTNISPDHLNRYRSLREYIKAKMNIVRFQHSSDWAVLPQEDPVFQAFRRATAARILSFSSGSIIRPGVGIKNGWLVAQRGLKMSKLFKLSEIENIRGLAPENLAAAVAAVVPFHVSQAALRQGLKNFKPLPGRQQAFSRRGGFLWVNDTTATSPAGTLFALKRFGGSKCVLIAGGQDKGLDYKDLARMIGESTGYLILLPGTASVKLWRLLSNRVKRRTARVSDLNAAVKKSIQHAQPGSTIMLSPSAASFNLFRNEYDRGQQFVKAVRRWARP